MARQGRIRTCPAFDFQQIISITVIRYADESSATKDFLHGIWKALVFGGAIALTSCYFGVTVRGGTVGVGRAVNAAVVAAAVSIMLLDFFLTYLTG